LGYPTRKSEFDKKHTPLELKYNHIRERLYKSFSKYNLKES